MAEHILGFKLGLNQPSIAIRFELIIPKNIKFEVIEKNLFDRFNIIPGAVKSHIKRPLSLPEQDAVKYIWQVMSLASALLNAIKIPTFDYVRLVELEKLDDQSEKYRTVIFFPKTNFYASNWIFECLKKAHNLALKFSDSSLDESEIGRELENLHDDFIVKAKSRIYGGDSTVAIIESAFLLDIPFTHIGQGIYQLGWGAKQRLCDRSTIEFDSAVGSKLSQNKFHTAHLLRQAGLPSPEHELVNSKEDALEAALRIGFPVVIKPADKDRGEGVTVNIYDASSVYSAFENASIFSKNILVEKHVDGVCHRILIVEGSSPYTIARLPLCVEGDGIHPIYELILKRNEKEARKAKHLRNSPLPSDELTEKMLAQTGLTLSDIPDVGQRVFLRPIENAEWGGIGEVVTDKVHPENIRIAVQSARLLNLHIAGIDLISKDITKPWHDNGAIINEINFAPLLGRRHEFNRLAARKILENFFPSGGRIPIEVYIGDQLAWNAALSRQKELVKQGLSSFITSHLLTENSEGEEKLDLPDDSFYLRVKALLMNRSVEALLLVVQTDEFLATGLPIDSINSLNIINKNLSSAKNPDNPISPSDMDVLVESFNAYLRPAHQSD